MSLKQPRRIICLRDRGLRVGRVWVFVCLTLAWSVPSDAAPTCPVLSLTTTNANALAATSVYPGAAVQSFTVEAWIYPTTSPASAYILTDDAYDLSYVFQSGAANGGRGIKWRLYGTGGGTTSVTQYRNVTLNQWNHVALIFDAATMNVGLAINGIVTNTAVTRTSFLNDAAYRFGVGAFNGTADFFTGHVDDVRISSVARYSGNFTPATTLNADASTRALYHFDEASTATAFADLSGFGRTLTASGGAQTAIVQCAPSVTAITPAAGPIAGGTAVSITGANFSAGATVAIGGVPATSVVVGGPTTLSAVTGAHAAGVVDVVVTNLDTQSGTLTNGFTYRGPPALMGISPSIGPDVGGTAVTVTGTDFVDGAAVAIGGAVATNVTVTSATSLTAITGPRTAGIVSVVVSNPDGQAGTLTNGFWYLAPPAITAISPVRGSFGGGTVVTISGTSFLAGAVVTIGGVAATGVSVDSATRITATTARNAPGVASVVVTNPDLQAGTLADAFSYGGAFSDDSLTARSTLVRAAHFTELRDRINTQRLRFGLAAVVWTDASLVGGVLGIVHLNELRSAVRDVYQARGRAAPNFTDDPLLAGQTNIKAVHIEELRLALVTLEVT